MLDTAWPVLGALLIGTLSALVPVVNAEAVALAAAANGTVAVAVGVALALAVGQTAGKLVIFTAARSGRTWRRRTRRDSRAAGPPGTTRRAGARIAVAAGLPGGAAARRWGRLRRRAMDVLGSRWRGGGVVLLSAAVGVPPLAVVSAGCGLARMRRGEFAACCLTGRSARFLVLTVPLAAWTG